VLKRRWFFQYFNFQTRNGHLWLKLEIKNAHISLQNNSNNKILRRFLDNNLAFKFYNRPIHSDIIVISHLTALCPTSQRKFAMSNTMSRGLLILNIFSYLYFMTFWSQDYEFVVYNSSEKNSFVKNRELVIIPTIQTDSFIRTGQLSLNG